MTFNSEVIIRIRHADDVAGSTKFRNQAVIGRCGDDEIQGFRADRDHVHEEKTADHAMVVHTPKKAVSVWVKAAIRVDDLSERCLM